MELGVGLHLRNTPSTGTNNGSKEPCATTPLKMWPNSALGTATYQTIVDYMEADLEMEENEHVSFETVLISDDAEES
eukprot:1576538-Ditylum_brightwellii.AAC.1